jgi:hypothetical protein
MAEAAAAALVLEQQQQAAAAGPEPVANDAVRSEPATIGTVTAPVSTAAGGTDSTTSGRTRVSSATLSSSSSKAEDDVGGASGADKCGVGGSAAPGGLQELESAKGGSGTAGHLV